jgi:hypothetical protein
MRQVRHSAKSFWTIFRTRSTLAGFHGFHSKR